MEFQFSFNFIAFFLFLATLLALFKEWKRSKNPNRSQKRPPGPWKLPLIGNLHQLIGTIPHHTLTNLAQKHGPLMSIQLGELPAVVVSSPNVAKEVLKTRDHAFLNRPKSVLGDIICYNYSDMGMAPYGDYWKQMRRITFQELFSAKKIRSLVSIREGEVSRLIASIRSSAGKTINLTEMFSSLTNSLIFKEVFGTVCTDEEQEAFIEAAREVTSASGGLDVADLFPSLKVLHAFSSLKSKMRKLHSKLDKLMDYMINEHVKNRLRTKGLGNGDLGEEDLVDVLLRIKETDELQFPITNTSIKALLVDMLIGGTDTSAITLDWAMSELMKNPAKMAKAQLEIRGALKGKKKIDEIDIQELKYIKLVIKETLRLHPPGPLSLPRECREDCELEGGYKICRGTKVLINIWAIGRDPEYWHDPESFEPERFEDSPFDYRGIHFEYIPFGSGRRMCPGLLLANAHLELPLAVLLYHFNWKLPDGVDLNMTEIFGSVSARRDKLLVIPTIYDASIDMSL